MKFLIQLAGILISGILVNGAPSSNVTDGTPKQENHVLDHSYAEDVLLSFEKPLNEWRTKRKFADWNYETNLTDVNLEKKLEVLQEASAHQKQVQRQISQLKWQDLQDENLKRQFCMWSFIGPEILPEKSFRETEQILSRAERIYNTLTICDFKDPKKCNLTLIPDLTAIMANSRDPEELKYIWTKWYDSVGKAMQPNFPRYVELLTEAAKLHNMTDITVGWLKRYDSDNITDQIGALWDEVKPLYTQLHTYVRGALRKQYGDNLVSKEDPIPAHLVGDLWSKTWSNLANISLPYPGKKPFDVTEEMIKQGYNVEKMYRLAEESFVSMGFPKLQSSFWEDSILTKPADRDIVCDSPPWDFNDGKNFRISGCSNVSMENLKNAYDELGVLQYFMQYKDQRLIIKHAANPGFREAIGGLVSLSTMTPSHLEKIGLLKINATDQEININNLYYKALDRVVNLPFAYVTEKWRWDVYKSKITSSKYNCHWWKLSQDIQGIKPPVERKNTDFDPGAEYHTAVDYTYLRYFVGTILQFQMHKQLCIDIGEYKPNDENSKPLHLCDLSHSTEVGNKLKAGMKLGSSVPWPDVLEKITGQRQMCASGLLEYFKPLHDWLKTENEKNKEHIGWKNPQKDCAM